MKKLADSSISAARCTREGEQSAAVELLCVRGCGCCCLRRLLLPLLRLLLLLSLQPLQLTLTLALALSYPYHPERSWDFVLHLVRYLRSDVAQ